MFKQTDHFLNKPFPLFETTKERLIMPFSFGFFVFLFLYVFQPFNIYESTHGAFITCIGYGLITTVISLINTSALGIILSRQTQESFKIKHSLLISIWFLLTIAIANWAYSIYLIPSKEVDDSIFTHLFYTLSVGAFPMTIGVYISERRLNKVNNDKANKVNIDIKNQPLDYKDTFLEFNSEITDDNLHINSKDLICIKSDGNYCEFYFYKNKLIKRKVLRYTMKMVTEIVKNNIKIVRTHRSFFVNIDKVIKVSGTARNISLHIANIDFTIPISRANEQIVTNTISHYHNK
ncbi:MAG: LytTR family transcriptional regulator [Bacteroidales bacterium]|nr:LytTR family transcriptional regulator [Bacteroidales bacterium]